MAQLGAKASTAIHDGDKEREITEKMKLKRENVQPNFPAEKQFPARRLLKSYSSVRLAKTHSY